MSEPMSSQNVKDFVEACRNRQMENFEKQKQSIMDKAIDEFMNNLSTTLHNTIKISLLTDGLYYKYNNNMLYSHNNCKCKSQPFSNDKMIDLSKAMVTNLECHISSKLCVWLYKCKEQILNIIVKELTNDIFSRENLKQYLESLDYPKECDYIVDMYTNFLNNSLESFLSKFNLTDDVTLTLKPSENTK